MRPIKFRGLTDSGWKVLDLTDSTGFARELLELMATDEHVFKFKFPLMQFTGLHDKNGKEIYEGDILASEFATVPVVFENGKFGLKFKNDYLRSIKAREKDFEIVGNIYESPDLLK